MKFRYMKNGESLRLDSARCTGCGGCIEVCPHGVFSLVETPEGWQAKILDPGDCMECGACAKNCPQAALHVESGVGCAAAVLHSLKTGGPPECGCGPGSGCCS
jgi:NAD-dependent dihydropyrimidine dehydrogenase PreA subunit